MTDTPPGGTDFSGTAFLEVIIRLTRIETTLEQIRRDRDELQREKQDHEGRLRALEKWKYMLATSLVTGLISAGMTIYGLLTRR